MSSILDEVASKAFRLSEDERAELAHDLIASLDEDNDSLREDAWDAEIEKRVKEIKSGKAQGRPAEEILAEIRARYS